MSRKITNEIFIRELNEIHPNLISLTEYKGSKEKIIVKCVEHDYEFTTKPNNLMSGRGCKYCANEARRKKKVKPINKVIDDFNKVHNFKFKYPNIENEYINNKSKITFICPLHGEHTIQALKHLQGEGCQKCKESTLEKTIRGILERNEIEYIYEFKGHTTSNKSIDFYIKDAQLAIECQGVQHFKPIEFFGGDNKFIEYIRRDIEKFNEVKSNNDKIVYIVSKNFKNDLNSPIFKGIYNDNVLFIEDVIEKPMLLINKITFNK